MTKTKILTHPRIKASDPAAVEAYLKTVKHPHAEVIHELRRIMLRINKTIGEEIKWNAPTFFFTGDMNPSNPKEYRRYLVIFNLSRQDCIRLVFLNGVRANDTTGLLEGNYADGRRVAHFYSLKDVKAKQTALQTAIKTMLQALEKSEIGVSPSSE